jgi:hypothetical protein
MIIDKNFCVNLLDLRGTRVCLLWPVALAQDVRIPNPSLAHDLYEQP